MPSSPTWPRADISMLLLALATAAPIWALNLNIMAKNYCYLFSYSCAGLPSTSIYSTFLIEGWRKKSVQTLRILIELVLCNIEQLLHTLDSPVPFVTNLCYPPQPFNFPSLLHPSSSLPYHKLKVADLEVILKSSGTGSAEMSEAVSIADEHRMIMSCMKFIDVSVLCHVVRLAINCHKSHILQKALNCKEDNQLLIVPMLLLSDLAQTLVNKHFWSKHQQIAQRQIGLPCIPQDGIACCSDAFENVEVEMKDGIMDKLLGYESSVFMDITKNEWGSLNMAWRSTAK
ncbi:hypothetical protein L208DRAFT_1378738 [Tricholoma matsutake]|nr:hypothetical protein L208DRAFT_1378738 [Tricholoma matsutake 945]